MAKQASINEIHGSIGNLTFYKTPNGYKVRRKTSLTKNQVLSNPRFLATRQNMAEFASAAKSAKVLISGIRPLLATAKDSFLRSRLLKAMRAVIATDALNTRGNRNVTKGVLTLLKGFNFNSKAPLESVFFAPFTAKIDRVAGTLKLDIPGFQPSIMLPPPPGATHFKIVSSGCEVDFLKQITNTDNLQTAPIPCDNNVTAAISHLHTLTPGSTLPLFMVMGVQFYQMVNGELYPLQDKTINSLAVIDVDNS